MAYLSLYRKYRPQTFAEIVGQDHVTTTLANAVEEGRLHHAYLFTGPRGTGKTSTARILAKALNCEHGPTATPCNACPVCETITAGANVDVIEIDAASHGGVDDVRDLRERVAFAPASARRKVYIVDECHMLSTAGWNAFLKTVEEPPGHVLFVFATTEPHKVLATILSRTQRFDFKRVSAGVLAEHVRDLGAREGLTFEAGAVDLIVRAGDGSVRDTLSVLDQVISFTGDNVSAHGVAEVLGAVPDELLVESADAIATGDVAALCTLTARASDGGIDLRQFARALVEHLRQLFLLQVAPDAGLVETTSERLARLRTQAGRVGRVELLRALDLLAEAQAQMRRGNTRLPLEIALAKAALPDASGDAGALAARLDRLERRVGIEQPPAQPREADTEPGSTSTTASSPPARTLPSTGRSEVSDVRESEVSDAPAAEVSDAPAAEVSDAPAAEVSDAPAEVPEPTPTQAPAENASAVARPVDLDLLRDSWPAVLEALKQRSKRLHAYLLQAYPADLRGGVLTLRFAPDYAFHAENCAREQDVVAAVVGEVLGAAVRVDCSVAEAGQENSRDMGQGGAEVPRVGAGAGSGLGSGGDSGGDDDEGAQVLEAELAAQAGAVPDERELHARALARLQRELGATVVEEG